MTKKKPNFKRVIINQGKRTERVIGKIYEEDCIFTKEVIGSRHLFRVLDAWGIDAKLFTEVLLPKNYIIRVMDVESHILYEIDAERFKDNSQYYHFNEDKLKDHRAQIFCSRKHWDKPGFNLNTEEKLKEWAKLGFFG